MGEDDWKHGQTEFYRSRVMLNDPDAATYAKHFCTTCKHWRGRWRCKAYPRGIPLDIRKGRVFHLEHYPGDGGVTYEPAK